LHRRFDVDKKKFRAPFKGELVFWYIRPDERVNKGDGKLLPGKEGRVISTKNANKHPHCGGHIKKEKNHQIGKQGVHKNWGAPNWRGGGRPFSGQPAA